MNFVSREQWGARPPKGSYSTIHATSSTAHWEGPHMGSFPHSSCDAKVRGIQDYHMDSQDWLDIAYNAVVCPHGYVYEGRGIGHDSAANGTNTGNDQSYAICYLGGEGDDFTDDAKTAFNDAANWLGQPLNYGHRDWFNTACPGDIIYDWVHAGHPSPGPSPEPEPEPEDEDMPAYSIVAQEGSQMQYISDMVTFKTELASPEAKNAIVWCVVAAGGKVYTNDPTGYYVCPPGTLDALPTNKLPSR